MSFGNLVSMLGAAAGGVNRGMEEVKRDKERQAELQWRDEQRARDRAAQDRAEQTRLGLAAAMAPTEAQAQEVAGPTMDGAPLNVYKAGGQGFPSMAEASTAATAYNAPEARLQRGSAVLAGQGDAAGAVRMESDAQRSKLAGMQVKQAEQSQADEQKRRAFATELHQGGWAGVPAIYSRYNDGYEATAVEDGKGGATIQRLKDGKPFGKPISFNSLADFYTTTMARFEPDKWVAAAEAAKKEQVARADSDRRYNLQEKLVNAQVGNYARMGSGDGAGGLKAGRLPEAVKLQHSSMKGQYDKLSEAIIKAKAEGMWNPKDPNAQQLMAQQAMLEVGMAKVLAPYVNSGQADADPLGLMSEAPAQSPAPAQAPAAQPAKQAPRMADEVKPKTKAAPVAPRGGNSDQQRRRELVDELERVRGTARSGQKVKDLEARIAELDRSKN